MSPFRGPFIWFHFRKTCHHISTVKCLHPTLSDNPNVHKYHQSPGSPLHSTERPSSRCYIMRTSQRVSLMKCLRFLTTGQVLGTFPWSRSARRLRAILPFRLPPSSAWRPLSDPSNSCYIIPTIAKIGYASQTRQDQSMRLVMSIIPRRDCLALLAARSLTPCSMDFATTSSV